MKTDVIARCTCCDKPLRGRIKWLELNSRTNEWSDPEVAPLPADQSQGAFPFGLTCAAKHLASAKAAYRA